MLNTISELQDKIIPYWRKKGVGLYVREDWCIKQVQISLLLIPDELQRQGIGTRIIKQILQYCDEHGFTATLNPTDQYGSDIDRLIAFYKR